MSKSNVTEMEQGIGSQMSLVATTTASAQPSERHSLDLSSKSKMQQPNVIRVFHGIYSTSEG
jgi:hypothetical protein